MNKLEQVQALLQSYRKIVDRLDEMYENHPSDLVNIRYITLAGVVSDLEAILE